MMKRFVLPVVLSLALIGCGDKKPAATAPAAKAAGDIAAGKVIAERNCKGCHGIDGKGMVPGIPNLASQSEQYLAGSIREYKEGKRAHAALRDMTAQMSDVDLRNVVSYYASLPAVAGAAAKDVPVVSPYEKGQKQAAACAKCHGEDGNSTTPGVPSFAGQQPLYLITAMQEYLRAERKSETMHAVLRDLKRIDMESVALYYASQMPMKRAAPPFGDPAAGEPLTAVCGGCHGVGGVSTDAATPTLASQEPNYLLKSIKAYKTSRHNEIMQRQVNSLGDRDIENIVAYYAVQPSRPAEKGKTMIEQLAEKCDRCHGSKLENPAMAVPKINGQDKSYLVMALRAYRDDRRESSAMHRMSLPFSDAVIDSLASRYAGQPAK